MERRITIMLAVAALSLGVAAGCEGDPGPAGSSCTVAADDATGMMTISCDDGTEVTVPAGSSCSVSEDAGTTTVSCDDGSTATVADGVNGTACTVSEAADGTKTITCDDGTEVVISDGSDGEDRLSSGTLVVEMMISTPDTGDYFGTGEEIVVTISVTDTVGNPVTIDELSSALLYMYGPNDVTDIITPSALLGASTDRSARPHHYIDLADTSTPGVVISDNVIEYTLQPITDELPGTYTVGFRGQRDGAPLDQVFVLADLQIGTSEVQEEIVGNCANCHEGENGQLYLHHVDPGHSPTGSPSIDSDPVRTCKTCHNNEGYAAYRACSDGTLQPCEGGATEVRVPDPIIRRVHGVHMGEMLRSEFNTDPDAGDFSDYLEVVFPANVKNCTTCHLDDSWKTEPSRLACGTCHDAVDFESGTIDPPKLGGACSSDSDCDTSWTCNTTSGTCELGTHLGGSYTDDTNCAVCHTSTSGSGAVPIPDSHEVSPPAFGVTVDVGISDPASGTYFVAGDSPVVTVTITDSGGTTVDPSTITEGSAWGRVNLFVSGPRARAMPVLTTAAEGLAQIRAQVASGAAPFDLSSATGDLGLVFDDGTGVNVALSSGTFADSSAATGSEVAAWLNGDSNFAAVATAESVTSRGTTTVYIKSKARGSSSSVEVLTGSVATGLGLTPGTYDPVETHSYPSNDLRVQGDSFDEDPRITRTSTAIEYQLDDVDGLAPGTYSVWVEAGNSYPVSWDLLTFQVGTGTEEPRVATNCVNCHGDERMHAGYFGINFEPDICRSCHDYDRQLEDRTTWTSGNMGYGAAPLARRVHGVHYGHYLDKPEEVHSSHDYSGVIFPHDVRSCTTCHSETSSWAENPSRVACLACHDSDAAITHGTLMTNDPTPSDPYSGDELESCATCHGPGRDYAPDVVHNITLPYVPPYPRSGGH